MYKNIKNKSKFLLASVSGINRRKIIIRQLINIVKNNNPNKILDIGSGLNNWSHVFPPSVEYHSVELKKETNPTFVGDFFELDLPSDYELIIATELIEHLPSTQLFFQRSFDLLSDEGALVISFPFLFKIHADPYDYFRFTAQGVQELVRDKFEIVNIESHGNRLQLIWEIFVDSKILYPLKLFNRLIAKVDYKNNSYPLGYVFVLRKK
jgi:hypothetical protein